MAELPEIFSYVGKALTSGRDELVFESSNRKGIFARNGNQLDRDNRYKGRQYIINFISKTIFISSECKRAITLAFDSEEGRECQKLLQQYFGKKDESVIKFIEYLENEYSDKEKFTYCTKITYHREIEIPKSKFDNNIKYFLVIGLFNDIVVDEPIKKIFLQKVEQNEGSPEMIISHEELSIELYHFSQLSRVKKFIENSSHKRGF